MYNWHVEQAEFCSVQVETFYFFATVSQTCPVDSPFPALKGTQGGPQPFCSMLGIKEQSHFQVVIMAAPDLTSVGRSHFLPQLRTISRFSHCEGKRG